MTLDSGQKHLLRLVAKDADHEGWAPVSAPVFHLLDDMPRELVTLERVGDQGRGRVRLTDEGRSVIDAMACLS